MNQKTVSSVIKEIYRLGEKLILEEDTGCLPELSKQMLAFVGINDKALDNCFIGVNVKTDVDEDLRPIPYTARASKSDYKPKFDAIDNTLPLLLSLLNDKGQPTFPEIMFSWTPNDGVGSIPDVYSLDKLTPESRKIVDSYFGKRDNPRESVDGEDGEKTKVHFVEHVYAKALELSGNEPCYVWICNTDFDARSRGDRLSFIMCISSSIKDILMTKSRCHRFFEFVMIIKSIYVRKLDDQRIREAEDATKVAIMSRNMSHNIGSHVMSYLKQHLSSVKDIVSDGILADLVVDGEVQKQSAEKVENSTLPFLMGMGHFISYLQERQDFIATIATDYIPYFASVNFKDGIYDELNPDKRALRHTDRKNGKTDNILLGNIARSEGLGRSTTPTELEQEAGRSHMKDIVLKFRSQFTGDPVEMNEQLNEGVSDSMNDSKYNSTIVGLNSFLREKIDIAKKELEEMREYDFSMPGGIIGRQAFFSVMENIIRNAAKHGNWRKEGKLELTLDLFTNQTSDRDRIPDNDNVDGCRSLRQVLEDFYFDAVDADDLYFMTITDNCYSSLKSLFKLQQGLREKYIDRKTGIMVDSNKGLKEMRISSAWLRAIHNERECFMPYPKYENTSKLCDEDKEIFAMDGKWDKIDKAKNMKAPVIYARICSPRDEFGDHPNQFLQYIICLTIPRKVAIISSQFETVSEKLRMRLVKNKWRVYTYQSFMDERNKSFEFILCDDISDPGIYEKVRPIATSRVYCMSDIESVNNKEKKDALFESLEYDDFFKENEKGYVPSEKFILELYKKRSGYEEGDVITIDDKNIITSSSEYVKAIQGTKSEYSYYVYRRHHESDQFADYMNNVQQREFVESISGSNSTDRLICHEKLDDRWFYRHLNVMKRRIAVIDERLFSKITGFEESSFNSHETEYYTKDRTALTNIQRNVHFFTIIKDSVIKDHFFLVGMQFKNGAPQFNESYQCYCKPLASMSFSHEAGLQVDLLPDVDSSVLSHYFDFITIHQGLLDKMYESFGIKYSTTEVEDKERLTHDLYTLLSCLHDKTIPLDKSEKVEKDSYVRSFLPGMIIHSGRSKPSKTDMPQQLPFIQYAALEHAVLDCKYSLVELLDFARYES